MDIIKDECCGKVMDTWHNSIWCKKKEGIIRAQLYKCFSCGMEHYREITWIPEYSQIIQYSDGVK